MTISRRSVFFIGGYDPQAADVFFDRMAKELQRFEATWGLSATLSPLAISATGEIGTATIEVRADDWAVTTHFGHLVLDGIVLKDFARPLPVRLLRSLVALADYLASGTFFKIARKAWRFALFFAYPFATIAFYAALAIVVALAVGNVSPVLPVALGLLGGILAFALLLYGPASRQRVFQLLDLWSFSRDFLRGRRPDAEALLERFAAAIAAHVREHRPDELILIGHSVGGALILDIAARCLQLDPRFAGQSRRCTVMTVGSIALALGLHPAAKAFRGRVQALIDDPRLAFVDIQCLIDPINFYKCDPVADMGLTPRLKEHPPGMPFALACVVRIRDMLEAATYARIKRRMLRVHYQYIFGNTKRYFYDFFMICCGPLALPERMLGLVTGPWPAPRSLPE